MTAFFVEKSCKTDQEARMKLPASMTTASVEDLLRDLGDAVNDLELTVPTRARHQAAGAEAALVQALATWSNDASVSKLRTYAKSADDDQIAHLASRLYGLAALLLADEILALDGGDLTRVARGEAMARLRLLGKEDPFSASRGPQLEIVCADHLAMAHPASIYTFDENGTASIKELPAFRRIVESVIIGRIVGAPYRKSLPSGFDRTLSVALYELMRNTEEHGRGDGSGNLRDKSIRGFQARKFALEPKRLASITSGSEPLHQYCSDLLPARAGNAQTQLIEISVFDTGPGMGPSLTGIAPDQLTYEEELKAVSKCFCKNVSRKHSSSSGLGLPNLADVLTRSGGFMRLRTGRCALFANFREDPVQEFGKGPVLRSWFGSEVPAPKVNGTLFTLIIPLRA